MYTGFETCFAPSWNASGASDVLTADASSRACRHQKVRTHRPPPRTLVSNLVETFFLYEAASTVAWQKQALSDTVEPNTVRLGI